MRKLTDVRWDIVHTIWQVVDVVVVGASSGAELGNGSGGNAVSVSAALVASQRILALATENLDMTRNVTGVMKESLDRADAYVLSLFSLFFSFSLAEPFVDELAVCAQ